LQLKQPSATEPVNTTALGEAPSWSTSEVILFLILIALTAVTRFRRLGSPAFVIFDERLVLMQAGAYLRGWPFFLSLHPPLAKLLVALSCDLFGDHAYARRIPSALFGTTLVPLNYLLARRMFLSSLAATLAGVLTLCEGFLLVNSRIAMINIFGVTFAAIAYLNLFRFRLTTRMRARRRAILIIGIALGCAIATKAVISEVTATLVISYLVIILYTETVPDRRALLWQTAAMLAMVGGLMVSIYVAAFLPYYHYGWWSGIGDLISYQHWVLTGNLALPHEGPYSSPVWSWPLMLRAFPYFSYLKQDGRTLTVWCGGNPAIWWEIPPALLICGFHAIKQRSLSWSFPPVAYSAYMLMWIPVRRYLLIYDFLSMSAIGIIAIAGVLTMCWNGELNLWEPLLLLTPQIAVLIFILRLTLGLAAAAAIIALWALIARRKNLEAGRFICACILASVGFTFIYFYPLWSSMPLSKAAYLERMWFKGPGLANWM
jgi:dolichyl-phosphate-mannose-protein mannosyltransferase